MKTFVLEDALLNEHPEIRIGNKVYPLDDRQKTVNEIFKLQKQAEEQAKKSGAELDYSSATTAVFELVFGKENAKEIDNMNLSFAAQQRLLEMVMAAVTGEEPERFQKAAK